MLELVWLRLNRACDRLGRGHAGNAWSLSQLVTTTHPHYTNRLQADNAHQTATHHTSYPTPTLAMATPASGLSRRRAPLGASAGPSSGQPSSPSLAPGQSGSGSYFAGSAGSSRPATPGQTGGGHKVAYDERDMETQEEKEMPKLTLMEEVLLLGLKDKQVSNGGVGIGEGRWVEVVLVWVWDVGLGGARSNYCGQLRHQSLQPTST